MDFFLARSFESWEVKLRAADYAGFLAQHGARILAQSPRRTVAVFPFGAGRYFMKWHHQPSERSLGLREWQWCERLRALGIATAKAVAAGDSFFISEEIPGAVSVEKILDRRQHQGRTPKILLDHVAGTVRAMHQAGIVHKDLYLGHLFWRKSEQRLTVIDLARVSRPRFFFWRWRLKDLASLLFSSALLNVPTRDKLYFFMTYLGKRRLGLMDQLAAIFIQRKAIRIGLHTQRLLQGAPELREATAHNSLETVLNRR